MKRLIICAAFAGALTTIALAVPCLSALADDNQSAKDAAPSNPLMAPAKYSPIQLRSYIERMQKTAIGSRQAGFGEAMVDASDRILNSNPPESLRSFAAGSLMDGLHQWADGEKNADADKRLAELSTKYLNDPDKKVAVTAAYYDLEQRVLHPEQIPPADVPKLLDEVKAAITGRLLNAKYMRLATGTETLINYLPTDEEAELRFKEFGRLFATSQDPALIKLGAQMKTEKRDPSKIIGAEKPADGNAANPAPQTAETADQWLTRIEAKIASLAGPDHNAEYNQEKSAFMEKYAKDPQRWRWNIMDARRAVAIPETRAGGTKAAKESLAAVMAANDAPPELREKAIVMNLKLDLFNHATMADIGKSLSDEIKTFPQAQQGPLAAALVLAFTVGRPDEQAITTLNDLKAASYGPIAAAAAAKIAVLENYVYLKTNPLELKFTAADGNAFNLESYRGKVVLIDFWATWCGPCVEGLPEIIEQYKKYHDQGFEIVGISLDDDKQALANFVKEKEMPWVQYFDGKAWENVYAKKYGLPGIPQLWLVGRDGHVVDFNARTQLPEKIAALLKQSDTVKTAAAMH